MANFILSAFADEAAQDFDTQLQVLKEEQIPLVELRGVSGKNCADLSVEDAKVLAGKLKAANIRLSALGSPYGKIGITDPFDAHFAQFANSLEVCKILECQKIRMFSFYLPHDGNPSDYREEVLSRLEKMVDLAEKNGILLAHENEKGIYGDTDVRCMDLYNYFGGRLGVIFDPANYIQCDVDPGAAYELQKDTITYFHMKDALKADGSVVSVGKGDGSVPTILQDVKNSRQGEVILTIEPHLHVFGGLQNLQEEKLLHKESYPDSRSAFHAATESLKKVLAGLKEV